MRWLRLAVPAGLAVLSSCTWLQPSRPVLVLLPPPPVHWQVAFPRLEFLVFAGAGPGPPARAVARDWRCPLQMPCGREVNTTILAWPFVPAGAESPPLGPGRLRPAGGFYPLSLRIFEGREVVELSWEDGAAALVVDRAAEAGRDMSGFNAARLCGFLRREADPWSMDLDAAAQRIADGEFDAWDLDHLAARDVGVSPGDGTWFLESPFSAPLTAAAGCVELDGTALGSHFLFSLAGECRRLQVGREEVMLLAGP